MVHKRMITTDIKVKTSLIYLYIILKMPTTVNYVLYKKDYQNEVNEIILFLDSKKKDFIPKAVFERSFPPQIIKLPAIHDLDNNVCYVGLDKCIEFFEEKSKIKDIVQKVEIFKKKNPGYQMGDSTKEVDDTL